MPQNRRLVDSNWVFKKKKNDQFSARLVARGYTKITGVYFTEKYSLVVTEIILHTIQLMWLIDKWYSHNIDPETAFLYAVL